MGRRCARSSAVPALPKRCGLGHRVTEFVRWDEQMALRAPGSKTTFKRLGHNSLMPQPGADALAELQAFLADNDDGLALQGALPSS